MEKIKSPCPALRGKRNRIFKILIVSGKYLIIFAFWQIFTEWVDYMYAKKTLQIIRGTRFSPTSNVQHLQISTTRHSILKLLDIQSQVGKKWCTLTNPLHSDRNVLFHGKLETSSMTYNNLYFRNGTKTSGLLVMFRAMLRCQAYFREAVIDHFWCS